MCMKHSVLTIVLILVGSLSTFAQLSKDKEISYRVSLSQALQQSDDNKILSNAKILAAHYKKNGDIIPYLDAQSKIYTALNSLEMDAVGYWQTEMQQAMPAYNSEDLTAIPDLATIKANCVNPKALMNLLRLRLLDLAATPTVDGLIYAEKLDKIAQELLKQAPTQSDKTFYLQQFYYHPINIYNYLHT